jgi:hypothetical protein
VVLGGLLQKAIVKKNAVDLRKDFDLPARVSIVKAKEIP